MKNVAVIVKHLILAKEHHETVFSLQQKKQKVKDEEGEEKQIKVKNINQKRIKP